MMTLKDIPYNYAYCFAGKALCPKADTCLRAIAAQMLRESTGTQPVRLQVVNELYVQRLADLSACEMYSDNSPVQFAKGMTRLFDDVPLKKSHHLRTRVMGCFSCDTYYYQSRRGERLITPEEQTAIAKVFRSAGITTAPQFDEIVEDYRW